MADPSIATNPWIAPISAVIGGIVVGLFGTLNNLINKKSSDNTTESEERRHFKELIFKTAIENWKQNNETAIELLKLKQPVMVMPLESYIVNLITLSDTLLDTKLTKENVIKKVKEAFEVSDEVDKYITDRFHAENKEQND